MVAVLVHELGHHATGATRTMLLVSWLTAPWCMARSLLTELSSILAGRRSRRGAVIAVVVGLAVAVTRTLHQGQWMVAAVLTFLMLAGCSVPSPTPRSAGGPSSPPTASLPTTASHGSWPPPFTYWMSAILRPADGRSGFWHPIRLPTSASARSSRRLPLRQATETAGCQGCATAPTGEWGAVDRPLRRDQALFTHPILPFSAIPNRRNQRSVPGLTSMFSVTKRKPTTQDQIVGLLVPVQSGEPYQAPDHRSAGPGRVERDRRVGQGASPPRRLAGCIRVSWKPSPATFVRTGVRAPHPVVTTPDEPEP
jgi:hypothetical protein